MFVCCIFSSESVSSNIELWAHTGSPLTFDYIKLSFPLSDAQVGAHRKESVCHCLFESNILQRWIRPAGADRLPMCSVCECCVFLRCPQADSCHRCNLWTVKVLLYKRVATVQIRSMVQCVHRKEKKNTRLCFIWRIPPNAETDHITSLSVPWSLEVALCTAENATNRADAIITTKHVGSRVKHVVYKDPSTNIVHKSHEKKSYFWTSGVKRFYVVWCW